MRGLILVDLDNVLERQPSGRELACFVRAAVGELAARVGRVDVGSCIVGVALNTTTATTYNFTFEVLRDAAAQLAGGLRAKLESLELGVVLTMPQAADFLLERLAREAPSREASGDYTFAALFSFDQGLTSSLHGFYRDRNLWSRASGNTLGAMWKAPDGVRPIHRTAPHAVRGSGTGAPPNASSYTIVIDNDALAGWASTRAVDVGSDTDLPELARAVDRDPWILSQIGATGTCLRGVRRIQELPSHAPVPLGEVSKSDRIEVRGVAPSPTEVSGAERASVGIGAVRFTNPGATIACRLPVGVLAMQTDVFLLDVRELNVGSALQRFPVADPLGAPITVRFAQRGSRCVARVQATRGSLDGWWVKHTATTAECSVELPSRLAGPIEARGQLMRSPGRCDWRVSIRSVLQRGDRVRLQTDVARGEVGQAWLDTGDGTIPAAVIALRTHHRRDDVIAVRPIHEVVALAPANYPESLGLVPLVVPL